MAENTNFAKDVFNTLASNFDDFEISEQDFYKKLDSDPEYATKVYDVMSTNLDDFKQDKDTFLTNLSPFKKKDQPEPSQEIGGSVSIEQPAVTSPSPSQLPSEEEPKDPLKAAQERAKKATDELNAKVKQINERGAQGLVNPKWAKDVYNLYKQQYDDEINNINDWYKGETTKPENVDPIALETARKDFEADEPFLLKRADEFSKNRQEYVKSKAAYKWRSIYKNVLKERGISGDEAEAQLDNLTQLGQLNIDPKTGEPMQTSYQVSMDRLKQIKNAIDENIFDEDKKKEAVDAFTVDAYAAVYQGLKDDNVVKNWAVLGGGNVFVGAGLDLLKQIEPDRAKNLEERINNPEAPARDKQLYLRELENIGLDAIAFESNRNLNRVTNAQELTGKKPTAAFVEGLNSWRQLAEKTKKSQQSRYPDVAEADIDRVLLDVTEGFETPKLTKGIYNIAVGASDWLDRSISAAWNYATKSRDGRIASDMANDHAKYIAEDILNYGDVGSSLRSEAVIPEIVDPSVKQKIDDIKKDNNLSDKQKYEQTYQLVRDAYNDGGIEFYANPNKGNINLTSKNILHLLSTSGARSFGNMFPTVMSGGGLAMTSIVAGLDAAANKYDEQFREGKNDPLARAARTGVTVGGLAGIMDEATALSNAFKGGRMTLASVRPTVTGAVKEFGEMQLKEQAEELATEALDGDIVKNWKDVVLSTALITPLLTGPTAIIGAKRDSQLYKQLWFEAGASPDATKNGLKKLLEDGDINDQQYKQGIERTDKLAQIVSTMPKVDRNGKPLTDLQKANYADNVMKKLDAAKASEVLPDSMVNEMKEQAKKADEQNAQILSGTEPAVTEEVKPEVKEKLKQEQGLTDADFVSEPFTPEEDAADRQALPQSEFASEADLKSTLETGEFAMLSGMNPEAMQISKAGNKKLNEKAKAWLEERGLKPVGIFGKYEGKTERSFFVPNMTREQSIEFANAFGQDSVAHSSGLVYKDGSFFPRSGTVNVEPRFESGADNFSTININGKPVDFEVGYDFNEKVQPEPETDFDKKIQAAQKSLEKTGVNINVIEDAAEYDKIASQAGGQKGTEGIFISEDGKIYINKAKLEKGVAEGLVVWHEAAHPVVNIVRNTSPDLFNKVVSGLKSASKDSKTVASALDWAAKNYEGQETVDDEAVVEVISRVAEGVINLDNVPTGLKQSIIDLINRMAKALGLGQVLSDTDVAAFKKLAGDVANALKTGQDISEVVGAENVGEFKLKVDDTKESFNNKDVQARFATDYFEDSDDFTKLEEDGFIVHDSDINDFNGETVVIHNPDSFASGNIKFRDKDLVKGEGGVYFVLMFGDVWASSKAETANQMAGLINTSLKESTDGKARVVLVKGDPSKNLTSVKGAKALMGVMEILADDGLIPLSAFRKALNAAGKKYGVEFDGRNDAKSIHKDIQDKFMNVSNSSFEKRGDFVKDVIDEIAKQDVLSKDDIAKIAESIGAKRKMTKFSKASVIDSVSFATTERMLRDVPNSHVYAIIETSSPVTIKKDGRHESYPWHIVTEDGSRPKLYILNNRPYFNDAFIAAKNTEKVKAGERFEDVSRAGLAQRGMGLAKIDMREPSKVQASKGERKSNSELFFDDADVLFPNDHILGGYAVTNEDGNLIGRISFTEVDDNTVKIDEIVSEKRGQKTGNGSAIMRMVIDNADKNNVTLKLMPNLIGEMKAKGFETPEKLRAFYSKFGFVKDKMSAFMIRPPMPKTQASKGNRLAPNGKPSNLNEKQYEQVRTPEFKAWFGDWENDPANASKIVDENGEPRVVYHGTNNTFDEFKKEKLGSKNWMAESAFMGFFFAGNKKTSEAYTGMNSLDMVGVSLGGYDEIINKYQPEIDKAKSDINEVYDRVRREESEKINTEMRAVLESSRGKLIESGLDKKTISDFFDDVINSRISYETVEKLAEKEIEKGGYRDKYKLVNQKIYSEIEAKWKENTGATPRIMELFINIKNPLVVDYKDIEQTNLSNNIQEAIGSGNDGVIFNNLKDGAETDDIFVALEANQIKSATDNTGAFSTTDNRIQFSVGRSATDIIADNIQIGKVEKAGRIEKFLKTMGDENFSVNWMDRLSRELLDSLAVFNKAAGRVQGIRGLEEVLPANDPRVLVRLLNGYDAAFNEAVSGGMFDAKYNKIKSKDGSVMNIDWLLEPLGKDLTREQYDTNVKETVVYMVASRVVELSKRLGKNKVIIGVGEKGISDLKRAKQALEELEQSPNIDNIKEAASRYQQMSDATLRYMVDKGRMSEESYKIIKENNLEYVALKRLSETPAGEPIEFSTKGGGKALGSVSEPIKAIKGSKKIIQDPYVSLLDNINKAMKEANRNEVLLSFRNLIAGEKDPDKIKKLESIGQKVGSKGKDTITIFVDGKPEYWKFQEDIYNALKNLDSEMYNLPGWLTALPRTMKWTVTHFPTFAARNVVRDWQSRLILSNNNPWESIKRSITTKDKWSEAARTGALNAGFYTQNKEFYYELLADATSKIKKEGNFVITPNKLKSLWHAYEKGLYKSETTGRVSEYEAAFNEAKKKGMDDYNAMLYAGSKARQLIDFAVAGNTMRVINQVIPFTNAAVQGLRAASKSIKENPAGFVTRVALFSLLPEMAVYALNGLDEEKKKNFEGLPDWKRDMFYAIPIGNNKYIYIPKPFELSLFGSALSRGMSYADGNKKAFDGYAGTAYKSLMPVEGSEIGGPFKSLIEVAVNKDFFRGTEIIPRSESKEDISLRSTEEASRIGKVIGDVMKADPRMVDHFIKSQFTYFGKLGIELSNIGREEARDKFKLAEKSGFVGEYSAYTSKPVQELRDFVDKWGIGGHPYMRYFKIVQDSYFAEKDPKQKGAIGIQMMEFAEQLVKIFNDLNIQQMQQLKKEMRK